jgi:predicted MFS family arabinose efflux permease
LAVAVFSVGVFFGVQLTLFNNFIVERLGIEAHELGYVEALREVPGFLNAFFIALMIRAAPPLVAAISLVVMGLGFMAYAGVATVSALALYSVVWSIGFHCWIPIEQSLALSLSPAGGKGRWLGQLRSVQSVGMLLAIGACIFLLPHLRYDGMFVVAGAVTVLGGAALLFIRRSAPIAGEKSFVFQRKYFLFYVLNFLQGCRKQMFITFAIFALVKVHGMPVETTMVLVLINQSLITVTGPILGRMIDRFGERVMLSASYLGLIFVFLGYATVQHRQTLYVLYCIDNLIFFGGIALTTYIHKIAPKEDLKPTISMGITMNHVAAVVAPVVGGVAWHFFGYQVIFFTGAAFALMSLIFSQWVTTEIAIQPAGHEHRAATGRPPQEPLRGS